MKKTDLVTAMKATMIGVEKSTKTLGMDFIVFDSDWLRSFRDDISVSYPLTTELQCAVKAEELFKIISKISGEEIDMGIEEDKFVLTDGKTVLKFRTLQTEQLEQILTRIDALQTNDLEWYLLPTNFMDGLNHCICSAGTETSLNEMAGIYISENKMFSTDNFRISTFTMNGMVISPFTIPTKSVDNLLKLNTEFISIALTKGWIHLSNKEGAIFSARLLSGKYPVDGIGEIFTQMEFEKSKEQYILPDGLEKSLDLVDIMAGTGEDILESITQVILNYKDGNLIISASRDIGEIIDIIPWPKDNMPTNMTLKMSPDFLRKILGITKVFKVSPTKKSVLFSGKNFSHLQVATIE